ncbi:MAG: hypothetical protein ACJA2E_001060, partial [Arenicella sp.]
MKKSMLLNKISVGVSLVLALTILPLNAALAQAALSTAEVRRIIGLVVSEGNARGAPATVAIVDRSGNVLGVYQMPGAAAQVTISSQRGIPAGNGLEGAVVPATFAAIAKAITGNYLSSGGNSFSTRVASQIVQEHFNPGEFNQPAGPLFGVQFSQLQCSDLTAEAGTTQGPKPSPLGLSADPGGFPLYKGGEVVGGIGVIADGLYSIDNSISDLDESIDEILAMAGTRGFEAPGPLRQVTLDGKLVRYSDATIAALRTTSPSQINNRQLVAVPGFFNGRIKSGVPFGSIASGFIASQDFGVPAVVLGDRFTPRAGTDAGALSANEVRVLIANA